MPTKTVKSKIIYPRIGMRWGYIPIGFKPYIKIFTKGVVSMIRGTNQEFRFGLSCRFDELAQIHIKFWQDNYNGPTNYRPLPIIKVKAQCTAPDGKPNQCSVVLNQEETLRFSDKRKARVQLRGVTYDGRPVATLEYLIKVYPVHDDSILDGDILPTPTYEDLIILDGQDVLQGG